MADDFVDEGIAAEEGVQDDLSDGASLNSATDSLASSVLNYEYENGRSYHAYKRGKYILPNDEKEQERLDLMHHIFRLTLNGGLCRAKLENPLKILDVGTGTGIWAMEIGDEYPAADVIGTDVSPIQPTWVPPNVRFHVDDVTEEWNFTKNSFDFIHVRTMAGSIRDWPKFLAEAYQHLKPGGQIELSEGRTHLVCDDGTYDADGDSQTAYWVREFHKIARAQGMDFDYFPHMAGDLRDAGYEVTTVEERPVPIGSWPRDARLKNLGKVFKLQFLTMAVDAYSMALFTRFGGWSQEATEVLLAGVRNDFKTNKFHVYTHCSFAVARKPFR